MNLFLSRQIQEAGDINLFLSFYLVLFAKVSITISEERTNPIIYSEGEPHNDI